MYNIVTSDYSRVIRSCCSLQQERQEWFAPSRYLLKSDGCKSFLLLFSKERWERLEQLTLYERAICSFNSGLCSILKRKLDLKMYNTFLQKTKERESLF